MADDAQLKRRKNLLTYESILTRIPPITNFVAQLGYFAAQPILSNPVVHAIEVARQGLTAQLEFCLHALRGRAESRPPLHDATNVARHKRGPKKGEAKAEHNQRLRMAALGLFRDEHNRSIHAYLADNDLLELRHSLGRFLNSEPRLKYLLKDGRRADPALRKEAVAIVQRRLGDENEEENVETRATRTILDRDELKRVAGRLRFDVQPRMARDGENKKPFTYSLTFLPHRLIVV